MLFDLDITDGVWFQFFGSKVDPVTGDVIYEDPVDDSKVQIRSMKPFLEEQIQSRERVVEYVLNPSTRQMERISSYKELSLKEAIKERENAYDYAIMDMVGFKNKRTKEDIACTRANKIALMKNPVFDRFFSRCQELLEAGALEQNEEAEKN